MSDVMIDAILEDFVKTVNKILNYSPEELPRLFEILAQLVSEIQEVHEREQNK